VTDIGDIHDLSHLKIRPGQNPAERIGKNVRPEVSKMSATVDGRATRVQADQWRLLGLEDLDFTVKGIEKFDRHVFILCRFWQKNQEFCGWRRSSRSMIR
jgi:hypothetical protein